MHVTVKNRHCFIYEELLFGLFGTTLNCSKVFRDPEDACLSEFRVDQLSLPANRGLGAAELLLPPSVPPHLCLGGSVSLARVGIIQH